MSGAKAIVDGSRPEQMVFDYRPKEFPVIVTETAKDFTSKKHSANHTGAFTINPLIAEKAGISRMQTESLERAVEAQALERLKEVQERAYQEAFELGLSEGSQKAFEENKAEFVARLEALDELLRSFEELKTRLVSENETQMVTLIFEVAKKIALREIRDNPQTILDVIRKVVEDSQTDERLVIKISNEDLQFIESLGELSVKDKEMMSKIRLESDVKIQSGGCILETNYGSIDASIPQRVQKTWELLAARTPKIKESGMGLPESADEKKNSEDADSWAAEIEKPDTDDSGSGEKA